MISPRNPGRGIKHADDKDDAYFLAELQRLNILPTGYIYDPVLRHDVSNEDVVIELNTDYSTRGLTANEIVAIVQAWQSGALSRDSMLDIFRRGEVLPEGRTNEEEVRLIAIGKPEPQPEPKPSSGL